jgi:hypothetical protein
MSKVIAMENKITEKLRLTAYADGHTAELSINGRNTRLPLISISYSHARLAANGRHGDFKKIGLRAGLDVGMGGGRFHCKVSWVSDNEIEVAFAEPLPLSISEMQDFFSRAA